ncbi:MAG: anaerobic ribonucleoside-triphosphate reductase activating protein [Bacteroidales bacterium]|nr:anaerobic ribonucleoside-triphosphate reductase activating protein [Candidatus Liminaster caballi]
MKIQLMQIVDDTTVDGPGWRTSVYCAGCRHACPGCHNPETWPFSAGEAVDVDAILARIADNAGNNVTFSGGDPMYQPEAFTELARRICEELHRTVWCYTGFRFEDVLADEKMSRMLPYLEVLVDGPFVESEKSLDLMFRGSRNQRLVDVQQSLKAGRVVEFEWNPYPEF